LTNPKIYARLDLTTKRGNKMTNNLSHNLNILSGESTVPVYVLANEPELINLIMNNATLEEALEWVNENF
jgi:hypothetical protein